MKIPKKSVESVQKLHERHQNLIGVVFVNFEQISPNVLLCPLLNLDK